MLSALYFFAIFLEIYTKVLTIYRKRYIIKSWKGGEKMLRWSTEKIKELIKLVQQLNKLAIEIISLVGWILILIKIIG